MGRDGHCREGLKSLAHSRSDGPEIQVGLAYQCMLAIVCQTIHQLQFDGVDDWVQITFHYNHASTERNVIGGIGMTEMGVIYLGEK